MALCGFNEKMLKGLTAFNEGLVEHGLLYRSKKNGETLDQAVKRELSDMTRLLQEINRIDDTEKRILAEGLVKYAMSFYLIMRMKGVDNIESDYKETIGKISNYFFEMDKKYYDELEGKSDDMRKLIEHLDKIKI
ncbi:hypothetical protein KO317_04215 [Candidatus Micrarchaeota archaeon]|nr:hypothetical protein [Candidatus Micrarchaeota archaeon]